MDVVELEGTEKHETPEAYLIDFGDGGEAVWVPKSIIEYRQQHEDYVAYEIQLWFAEKQELI